jgi:magnesium-transporting ATPase (P-type)
MVERFCDWLASTHISQLFSGAEWFVPAVQTIHILAISAAVTLLAMLNFRLLRITRTGPTLHSLAMSYIPLVWGSLLVLFVSGTLLTITEPARELLNNVFRLKMLLVAILIALTVVLRSTLRRDPAYWTVNSRRRLLGKALAVTILVLCIGIVAAGRLIAYA